MVGRRIGSAIQSRKTKIVYARVYFGDNFRRYWETLRTRSSSNRETCWGQRYLLESRKKSENSCSCKSATRLVRFAGTNILKMSGRGFGWGNGRVLVGCDWISHYIPIAFSYPEILHATRVSTNTVLIQFLMHLSAIGAWSFCWSGWSGSSSSLAFTHALINANFTGHTTVNFRCVWTLHVACGGSIARICGKQLHGAPRKGFAEPPLWSHDAP